MALPKKPSGTAFRKQKRYRGRSDLDKQVAIKNWLLPPKSNLLLQPMMITHTQFKITY